MEESTSDFEIFLEVHSGLPRQGPGSDESTLKALSYCNTLPEEPAILDVGCGRGMQTLALAKALDCRIKAVDVVDEYLNILRERAEESNFSDRIEILKCDMNDLQFRPESFDIIWAEGSAYIMGVEKALANWKRFLKPGGYISFSELVWLKPDPPDQVTRFFQKEYPPMTNVETNLSKLRASKYETIANFTLPDSAWWDDYYNPLEAKLPTLKETFKDNRIARIALNIIDSTALEIEMRRKNEEWYGYEFFIGQKV